MKYEFLKRLAPPAGSRLLITGGCGGIGRCLVKTALESGLELAVFDLATAFTQTNLPTEVHCFELDASDERSVSSAMSELDGLWDGLEGLVNLAGYMGEPQRVQEADLSAWDAVFSASYDSTLNVCRAALPMLRKGDELPAVVNMSSGLADVCNPGYGPYSSAKAAIVALTKTLAKECAPEIRFNAVAPGGIRTPFLTGGTGREQVPQRLDEQAYLRMVPMGRMGEATDVVGPILFLLSDAARYMTGQVLYIDGGALMPA